MINSLSDRFVKKVRSDDFYNLNFYDFFNLFIRI